MVHCVQQGGPYAGNRVTDDIAYACAASRMDAEGIKVNYGSALNPRVTVWIKKLKLQVSAVVHHGF